MGYGDWIDMHLTNTLDGSIVVQNAQLDSGKFYTNDDKDNEISAEQVDEIVVAEDGGSNNVYSCGREDTAVGTQGSFELYDETNYNKICTINWSCPYSGSNYLYASNTNTNYSVGIPSVSLSGPIGFVDISLGGAW
ncbi:hypothetical protein PABG_04119 [Paracoccidioides brasiliensis Pb03]|nr:hypothetical protein PABG_04119 [Paracoccidioides brasiliensis Pb03]